VRREGGRLRAAGGDPLANRIPEGLRDVIGRRLSHLSPAYNRVLAVAGRIGFRPEIALTRLGLAELELGAAPSPSPSPAPRERGAAAAPGQDENDAGPSPSPAARGRGSGGGGRTEALVHLDFAIAEFRAMQMQPALERAERLHAAITAGAGPHSAPGTRHPAPGTRHPALPDGLTEREVEVLSRLAAGRTNREVAEELVLSVGTVERHVANIYRKISAGGRAEATAYALRHSLLPDAGAEH
jgi:DNA-binding CsgD family transcriptional regulator